MSEHPSIDRRSFLAASAASMPFIGMLGAAPAKVPHPAAPKQPVAISSRNGMATVARAVELMHEGTDPLEAAVAGVNIVEDDPNDMSVGYGGLPNERGVVELDACVMHGPTHQAGSVASLQNIRNPSKVAMLVMQRTDHVILVGEGALQFALEHGFEEENLLTDRARQAWLRWRQRLNRRDNWLEPDQFTDRDSEPLRSDEDIPFTDGTIHCAAVNTNGDLGSVTTTSGLSYKLSGRVGDSPIIGAGNYTDNLVGSAGATGRGEAVIKSCGAYQAVQHMANGDDPTEACLKVLRDIARRNRREMLRDDQGRPNFNVIMYALRKDGAYGSAAFRPGREFAVHDGDQARAMPCAVLFDD